MAILERTRCLRKSIEFALEIKRHGHLHFFPALIFIIRLYTWRSGSLHTQRAQIYIGCHRTLY